MPYQSKLKVYDHEGKSCPRIDSASTRPASQSIMRRVSVVILLMTSLPNFTLAHPRFGLRNRGFRPHHIHVLHHHPQPPALSVQISLESAADSARPLGSHTPDHDPGTTATVTSPAAAAAAFEFEPQPQYITLSPPAQSSNLPKLALTSINGLTFLGEAEDDDWITFGQQYKEQQQWRRCKVLKFGESLLKLGADHEDGWEHLDYVFANNGGGATLSERSHLLRFDVRTLMQPISYLESRDRPLH